MIAEFVGGTLDGQVRDMANDPGMYFNAVVPPLLRWGQPDPDEPLTLHIHRYRRDMQCHVSGHWIYVWDGER